MGYFDGLVSGIFKKDVAGNSVFYPWGIMGRGYVIRSAAEEERLRRSVKRMYIIMLPVVVGVQISFGPWPNVAIVLLFMVGFTLWTWRVTEGMERSTEKLGVGEAYRNSAKSHNLPTLIILEIISLLFVVAGAWMVLDGHDIVIGVLCALFFAFCAAAIGYMIKQKVKG
ncbi:MAG: hypothetical protein H6858_09520 [Rhodospirillales bacterium]|nr:hypothetical protein [Alphaproteobacteria bacterium]MCB1841043.1 hypothetical protein [Alphaproteobacteria bacterium]MCB9977824.1 hypothetical protein [Rhodospirillales bacterium]